MAELADVYREVKFTKRKFENFSCLLAGNEIEIEREIIAIKYRLKNSMTNRLLGDARD